MDGGSGRFFRAAAAAGAHRLRSQPPSRRPGHAALLRRVSSPLLLLLLMLLLLLLLGSAHAGQATAFTTAAFVPHSPLSSFHWCWTRSSSSSSPRTTTTALAAKGKGGGKGGGMGREELKNALVAEGLEEILAARAVEAAEKAVATWDTQATDFCRPPEVAALQRVLGRVADLAITAQGGFPQAERRRVFFSRALEDYSGGWGDDGAGEGKGDDAVAALPEELLPYFQAVAVEGNFLFDKAGHRDFLGAVLGTGIAREKVGDILIQGERGAHVILAPEVAEYITGSLASVRSVPVKNSFIAVAELGVRPPVKKEMQSVEASMRLDAVASAGMGMSRGKVKDMIEGGDVLVNWKEVTSANAQLKEGDIVTVRGKGRLEIAAVEKTSKDKYRVKMTKFA